MAAYGMSSRGPLLKAASNAHQGVLNRSPVALISTLPARLTTDRIRTLVAAPNKDDIATVEEMFERPAYVHDEQLVASTSELDIKMAERRKQRQSEQVTYQASAIAATIGVTSLAVVATYLRFDWHLNDDGQMPWLELLGTLTLVAGGVFGMEMYARFAHKVLWHDFAPGWALHKSHHMPRTGPFEDNDIFAVINGVPAMLLCLYGFLTPGMLGGACFGAGLGITLFGIMYMFVHDGLVHRRFPVGPIAELPYLKRLAVAHQLHHAEKYDGVPWGMFLAMQELENIPGAKEEVDRLVAELDFKARK